MRGPGATRTLSSREIFLRSQEVDPRQPHLWTACRFVTKATVRPERERAEGLIFDLLAPCRRSPPCLPPLQVLSQLEACGLVETIHISAAGFPIR